MSAKSQGGALGPGALRLFLASIVVLHHSFPLRMGAWAVFVFFLLSGYWISVMWDAKYARAKKPLQTYIVSRWWRLAPVFFTCTILAAIATKVIPGYTFDQVASPLWWGRQLLILFSASAGRILPPSWSLDVEMQFYLIAPVLLWVFSKVKTPGRLAIVAVAIAYLLFAVLKKGEQAETPRVDLYLGFFCLGLTLAKTKWSPSKPVAWSTFGLFFAITFALIAWHHTRSGIWYRGADNLAAGTGPTPTWPTAWWVIGALLCAPYVAWNTKIKSSKQDRWLGNLAYPLYLFHWIPREWYYAHYNPHAGMVHNAPLLLANWIAAAAGAILILQFVDTPLDKLRARWVNARVAKAGALTSVQELSASETTQAPA